MTAVRADLEFIATQLALARYRLAQLRQEIDRHALFLTTPPAETLAEWLRQLEHADDEAETAYDEAANAICATEDVAAITTTGGVRHV